MPRTLFAVAATWAGSALAVVVVPGLATGCASGAAGETGPPPRFEALDDGEAWTQLSAPAARLPAWARTFAPTLPATTAFHLDLDHEQRSRNPLGPMLAARLRWVVADANRCAWSKEVAESDLKAAGQEVGDLADGGPSLPEPERLALAFARRLTLEAAAISDEEVAKLIEALGPDDAVAVVHTICYANFQDRIALALGLESEPGGPVAALRSPSPGDHERKAPPRVVPAAAPTPAESTDDRAPIAWSEHTYEDLRAALESQRTRAARIPNPDPVRKSRLPRPMRARTGRIAWGTVSMGYQPDLTRAWFRTMETFEEEAGLDVAFTSSVFWVITRTSDCFY